MIPASCRIEDCALIEESFKTRVHEFFGLRLVRGGICKVSTLYRVINGRCKALCLLQVFLTMLCHPPCVQKHDMWVCVKATDGVNLWDHDWQRAARMASYGFLIYGPLSQVWYEILDHFMPVKNLTNLSLKVFYEGLYPKVSSSTTI